MRESILILLDYKKQFWLKSNFKEATFNFSRLEDSFKEYGYNVVYKKFSDVDLKRDQFSDIYVIYQSSEDPNLHYKSYIEDILYGIKLKGGIIIPDWIYLRAHHNKVFMEILRDVNPNVSLKTLKSEYFGTYEDYFNKLADYKDEKRVLKSSDGAQSKNVHLLQTNNDFVSKPFKISRSFTFYYWIIDKIKPLLRKKYPDYRRKSHNRKKFILQEFVEGLECDFKILVYHNKMFVLERLVRKNDFRASGSGKFRFTKELPDGLLDYAESCFDSFEVPFVSLDIAHKKGKFYLIEFQFVQFGNYTLEKSPFYFSKNNKVWNVIDNPSDLEMEFANAIHKFIQRLKKIK